MSIVLGLGHKARHGKDNAARAIIEFYEIQNRTLYRHGMRGNLPEIRRIAFADALRRESSAAISKAGGIGRLLEKGFRDDVSGNWVDIPAWVTEDPNPDMSDPLLPFGKHSKLLQWWGTDYRRCQIADYWVNQVAREIKDFKGLVIITDVRFPNEASFVKANGGFLINVTRLNEDGTPFVDPTRPKYHISEIALDGYNWDGYICTKTGQEALAAEQAITLANFFVELAGGR